MHINGTNIINECNEQMGPFSKKSEASDNNNFPLNNESSIPTVEGIKVDDQDILSWHCNNCTININITINEVDIKDCKEHLKKLKVNLPKANDVKRDEMKKTETIQVEPEKTSTIKIQLSVKEQRERAKNYIKQEQAKEIINKQKLINKLTAKEQRERARLWAENEFPNLSK